MKSFVAKEVNKEVDRRITNNNKSSEKKLFGRLQKPGVNVHRKWSEIKKRLKEEIAQITGSIDKEAVGR